jgi:branched-subunit amino acid aminotransferase/4-amino-4-deoxychorismate lyase
MTVLAVAVAGRGLVDPAAPVFTAGDEALLRGGAAFETLRVYDGRPFLLERHLERLAHSAVALALPPPAGADALVSLVLGAAPPDHVLRLYRTGDALVATAAPLPVGLEELRNRGLTLASVSTGASSLLGGVKATSYAEAFAARRSVDADDVLLVTGEVVRECATANIWWARDGALYTPAAGPGVLPGVTRSFVLELEPEAQEGTLPLAELLAADEAFTTSSIREVMPVRAVDGHPIGGGVPGPVTARLQAALRLRSAQ